MQVSCQKKRKKKKTKILSTQKAAKMKTKNKNTTPKSRNLQTHNKNHGVHIYIYSALCLFGSCLLALLLRFSYLPNEKGFYNARTKWNKNVTNFLAFICNICFCYFHFELSRKGISFVMVRVINIINSNASTSVHCFTANGVDVNV